MSIVVPVLCCAALTFDSDDDSPTTGTNWISLLWLLSIGGRSNWRMYRSSRRSHSSFRKLPVTVFRRKGLKREVSRNERWITNVSIALQSRFIVAVCTTDSREASE